MIRIKCKARKDEDSDVLGLVPHIFEASGWFGYGKYIPSTGLGHDLIAHCRKENGSFEHELRALGAEIWLSEFYSFHNNHFANRTNEEIFASDIISAFHDAFLSSFEDIPACKKYPQFEELEELTEFFEVAFAKFLRDIPSELDLEVEGDEDKTFELWCEQNKKTMLDWVAYGFWYASKVRYRNLEAYDVFYLRKRLNDLSKEISRLEEGEKATIVYNLRGHVELINHGFPGDRFYR